MNEGIYLKFGLDEPVAVSKPMVTIGCDPEFFLKGKYRGTNISAHGKVPGTKAQPHKLKHGAVQLDGTAVEFNILPSKTPEEFSKNIRGVIGEIREMVPDKYRFNFSPSVVYAPLYFKDKIPEGSKELGCDPDFDAYQWGKPNARPDNSSAMRTGAGHLHIGWTEGKDTTDQSHVVDACLLARQLDCVFRMVEHLWDDDTERRKMYGNLGCFRPKPYGMEYRSLSNAWVKYPKLWPWLFAVCDDVYRVTKQGYDLSKYLDNEKVGPRVFRRLTEATYLFNQNLICFPEKFKEEVLDA